MNHEPEVAQEVRRIVRKYARLHRAGRHRPMRCMPSNAELSGEIPRRVMRGTDGKVIYNNKTIALAAARELQQVCGTPLIAYECSRSRHGHYHLKTDLWADDRGRRKKTRR